MKTCRAGHSYDENRRQCPVCKMASTDRWRAANPERVTYNKRMWRRSNRRRSKYGLSSQQYADLLAKHDKCEICGDSARLVIDHDHDSGAVRGVLCNRCNLMLGFSGDSVERLVRAAAYLAVFISGSEP